VAKSGTRAPASGIHAGGERVLLNEFAARLDLVAISLAKMSLASSISLTLTWSSERASISSVVSQS
jgi:hypothetical protein